MPSTTIFTKLKLAQVNGTPINFASDALSYLWVVAGSGAPNTTKSGSQYVSDVTASNAEVTGTGYARQPLTSVTVGFDTTASNQVDFSHASATWMQNASGFTTGRYLILAKITGLDTTSQVVYYYDPATTVSTQSGDVVISSPAGGEIQWV